MCAKKVAFVARRRKILHLLIKFHGTTNLTYLSVSTTEDKDMFTYNLSDAQSM